MRIVLKETNEERNQKMSEELDKETALTSSSAKLKSIKKAQDSNNKDYNINEISEKDE